MAGPQGPHQPSLPLPSPSMLYLGPRSPVQLVSSSTQPSPALPSHRPPEPAPTHGLMSYPSLASACPCPHPQGGDRCPGLGCPPPALLHGWAGGRPAAPWCPHAPLLRGDPVQLKAVCFLKRWANVPFFPAHLQTSGIFGR